MYFVIVSDMNVAKNAELPAVYRDKVRITASRQFPVPENGGALVLAPDTRRICASLEEALEYIAQREQVTMEETEQEQDTGE